MKLKLRLYRKDCTLFGWVEYQDSKLRAEKDEDKILARNSKFTISSYHSPSLGYDELFVKGSCETRDDNMFLYIYSSIDEAINIANHIKSLVKEINSVDSSWDDDIERIL